jgi:anti-sigma factor RsiW
MNMHDEESAVALRYVQGELAGQELTEFSRHLATCRECKARVEEEIALSELFRKTSPLYKAPDDLRTRVSALVNQAVLDAQPAPEGQKPIRQILKEKIWSRWDTWRWFSLVAATAVLTVGVTISLGFFREFGAQNYVRAAVTAHEENLEGKASLDVNSESPLVIRQWVEQRVPFDFHLPIFQPGVTNGSPYHITGARLIAYRGQPAVVIAYRMQAQIVSLLVVPHHAATIAGGDEVRDGALLFHYRSDSGFNVITWENHGLSYALVSSVSGSAQQSCLVCHGPSSLH